MKNRNELFNKTYPLQLNIFLFFYVYVLLVLIIANLLPVSSLTYFLFLALGIIGVCILLVKYKYNILITKTTIFLSIKIPLKISLLKLKIKEIKALEEITIDPLSHGYGIKKLKEYHTAYMFNKGKGIRLTMQSGKVFIISCPDVNNIITHINALKNRQEN